METIRGKCDRILVTGTTIVLRGSHPIALVTHLCVMGARGQTLGRDLDLEGSADVHEFEVSRAEDPGRVARQRESHLKVDLRTRFCVGNTPAKMNRLTTPSGGPFSQRFDAA